MKPAGTTFSSAFLMILTSYQQLQACVSHHEYDPARGTPSGVQYELAPTRKGKAGAHPARLIKEGGCENLSMDTLHIKYPLGLFGSEGSALIPPFLLSPRIIMPYNCYSTVAGGHFLVIFYGTK